MTTQTQAYQYIKESGIQETIQHIVFNVLKQNPVGIFSLLELTQIINLAKSKKISDRSILARLTELHGAGLATKSHIITCSISEMEVFGWQWSGKEFTEAIEYKAKRKLISKEMIVEAFSKSQDVAVVLALLGFEEE